MIDPEGRTRARAEGLTATRLLIIDILLQFNL